MLSDCCALLVLPFRLGQARTCPHYLEQFASWDDCHVPCAVPLVGHNQSVLKHLCQYLFAAAIAHNVPAAIRSRVSTQHRSPTESAGCHSHTTPDGILPDGRIRPTRNENISSALGCQWTWTVSHPPAGISVVTADDQVDRVTEPASALLAYVPLAESAERVLRSRARHQLSSTVITNAWRAWSVR